MKILVNEQISKNGEIALQGAGFEIINTKVAQQQLESFITDENIDAIIVGNTTQIQQELIDACPSLKLIACKNSNLDAIDVQYAQDQGLHVIYPKEAVNNAVAELVFAHLLGMNRFLHQANREMPLEGDINFNNLKKAFVGTELRGKTLGLIGMNEIAIATAKIALGLGMKVIFSNNKPKSVSIPIEFFDGQGVEFSFDAVPLDEVLQQADFISLCEAEQEDGYTISENEFEKMKNGVGIVNCVDASILDEVALVKAIDNGKVKFAGLDVFEKAPTPEIQLLMNTDLSLSPNIAEATIEANNKIGTELATQIIELLS